jgi:hypothetical protein
VIRLPRWFIVFISVLLVINPAATGILTFYRYNNQVFALAALILYLLAGIVSVLYSRQLKMPVMLALVNLAMAVVVPQLINQSLDLSARGSHATWYVTGIATLMAINAVRQHKVIAWLGSALLTAQVLLWGGFEFMFNSGLAGALALVAAAHAISIGLERSSREAANYLEIAKATEVSSAADSAIRSERSERLTKTLRGALPMLQKIASGQISDSDRHQARLLEAELRDEIRGRLLLNPKLKASVRQARERGVEVVLLDEGGLDQLSEPNRESIRSRLADELDLIKQGRVTIRSPHRDKARATFVASRAGTAAPDVFLRL